MFTDLNSVSFHNFKSQVFKLSISNPKGKYVAYLSVLSQISNCHSLGRKNKHEILKTDRTHNIYIYIYVYVYILLLLLLLIIIRITTTMRCKTAVRYETALLPRAEASDAIDVGLYTRSWLNLLIILITYIHIYAYTYTYIYMYIYIYIYMITPPHINTTTMQHKTAPPPKPRHSVPLAV